MNENGILSVQQRGVTSPTLRPIIGSDAEYEAVVADLGQLEVRSMEWEIQKDGAAEIETENEQNNPIYKLNLNLGFRPEPALLNFKKLIEPGELIQTEGKETIITFT